MDQPSLPLYNMCVSDQEMTIGGNAYLIRGTVDSRLWQGAQQPAAPTPPVSIWSRIARLGHSGATQTLPKVTTYPDGDRLIELQADPLPNRLIPDFLSWVKSHLTPPSQASGVVLEYLKAITPTLYVRGGQSPSDPSPAFYI